MTKTTRTLALALGATAAIMSAATVLLAADAPKADAKQPIAYPLDHCLVSGETFGGDMGDPVVMVDGEQEFKFCCKKCIKEFKADPAKFYDKLNQEIIKTQKASYPLESCVVSGEKLDDKALDYVYRGQLVRFCDKECVGKFIADPAKYLAKIEAARKAKKS